MKGGSCVLFPKIGTKQIRSEPEVSLIHCAMGF